MSKTLSTRRCGTCAWVGDADECPRCGMVTVKYRVVLR